MYLFHPAPSALETPRRDGNSHLPADVPLAVDWAEGCYAVYVAHQFRAWPLWLATCTDSRQENFSSISTPLR